MVEKGQCPTETVFFYVRCFLIKNVYFQLLRMAIHQKLVLTQRLEDIEMTDLRPANVIITTIVIMIITLTTPPSPTL